MVLAVNTSDLPLSCDSLDYTGRRSTWPEPTTTPPSSWFGSKVLSPRMHGNVSVIGPSIPKVVLRGISVQCTMKICKRMFMDTIDSFSDEAGDLMKEVYQHNTKVLSPRKHGRVKEKHKAKSKQVCHYLLCFCLSFVVVLVLHYISKTFLFTVLY